MTPPTEPEGWVLVPREPTEAMQRAAHYELGVWRGSDDACMLGFEGAAKAYRLMIAAAPPAPVEPMRKALSDEDVELIKQGRSWASPRNISRDMAAAKQLITRLVDALEGRL